MPWCPECKTEYREGFRVCADCGSELVEEEPEDTGEAVLAEEARSVEYAAGMAGSGDRVFEPHRAEARSVEYAADMAGEGSGQDGESVSMEGPKEPEESCSGDAADMQDGEIRPAGAVRDGLYQDSSERASDNRSSAWVLLCLGVLGVIAVALGAAGILPLHFGNPYLMYGVMGAIFILFVVAGIVSMKNAKIFEKKAESENSLRQTLLDWCRENLDSRDIDGTVGAAGAPDEIAYFRRTAYIKEKLNHQFVNLNQGFLEQFIDDYIYDEIFGEKAE